MGEENLARQAELALERQGDHDSLFYEGRWHTAGSLADRAARLATGLADLGVRPGDRLVVLMANCPEVLITYSAAWRAGAVVTPLIFLVSEDELRHALVDSGAVGVVTTAEFLPKVSAALAGVPSVRFVVVPGAGTAAGSTAPGVPGVPVLDFAQVEAAEPGSIVGPVGDRPGRPAVHRRHDRAVQGRSAQSREPVLVRVGGEPEFGGGGREHRARAAPPRACLRAPGLLHRLSPGRGRPGPS